MKRMPVVLAVLAASACEDDFVKGWLVDRTRALGARVEAVADPARASIAPGEPTRVTWLVGAPNGTPPLDWAFAVCAVPIGQRPEARCVGPALNSGSGRTHGERVPMEFVAPPAEAIGDAQELLVLAAFCESAAPDGGGAGAALDPGRFVATCAGGGQALLASATVRLAVQGPNRNPDLMPDAVLFDGAPMADDPARPGAPCAGGPSPIVAKGTKHGLTFRFRQEDREPSESMIVSHVVTAGELDRQYSALDPEEPAPKEVAVPWTAPGEERLVEFFVVLRDGRGGTAFVRRTVCVRP